MFQRFLALSLVATAVIAGLPARAQSAIQLQQQLKADGSGAKQPLPVHLNASLTHTVGSGTFVVAPFNPTVSSQLTLNPLIAWNGFSFFMNESFGFEWTESDYTTTRGQIELSDPVIGARYGKLGLPDLNLALVPTVSVQLPLTMSSRQAGSIGTAVVGARGIWSIPDAGVSLYVNASTGYTQLVPSLSARFAGLPTKGGTGDNGKPLEAQGCITRNPQELLAYACGSTPSFLRWSTGTGVNWSTFGDQVSFSLDLAYGQAFSADYGEDDEYRADNAVVGYGLRQSTSGNLSATWIPLSWMFITLGVSSFQPAFSADGKRLRFPLWDFEGPYNNNSGIYFDTTFSI